MKLGIIGEEMLATAVKLAAEHGAEVEALHVIRVPLEQPLDAPMHRRRSARPRRRSPRRRRSAPTTASTSKATTVRARAIGQAIVEHAARSTPT